MLYFSRLKSVLILGTCLISIVLCIPSFLKPGLLPDWVPQPKINLGLDLQGGSYLLLEVDMDNVVRERIAGTRSAVAEALQRAKIPIGSVQIAGGEVAAVSPDVNQIPKIRDALRDVLTEKSDGMSHPLMYSTTMDGNTLRVSFTAQALNDLATKTVQQSISIVRRRIDETGVNEPVVARQGKNRILVELPGVSEPDRIKKLLGSTAKMTFRLVGVEGAGPNADVELLPFVYKAGRGEKLPIKRHVEVDGMNLTRATAALDRRSGGWVVDFGLDSIGTRHFANVTTAHVGQPFAIVLDNKVISAPVIREPIVGGQGQISGNFTVEEANDLAVLLRAGALPAPLKMVEEKTVGPNLGADAIRAGLNSIVAGFVLVVTFMLVTYGRFGVYAAIALVMNLAITIAALAMLGATLTLPGMAGILLALGMAVDANILINERTREELQKKNGVIASIEAGYRRAYTTIIDANTTTLIKMLILFVIGIGAIRGFAVTISLGIVISMFTAIVLVRVLTSYWLRRYRPKTLTIGTRFRFFPDGTSIPFMRARYAGLLTSALISLASIGLAMHPGLKMGIDFAGGVIIEAKATGVVDATALQSNLTNKGLGPFEVQSFGSADDVLLHFQNPQGTPEQQQAVLRSTRDAVEAALPGAEIRRVEMVGPSVGAEMLSNGLWALALAAVAMFAYITFRFEWPFAAGAIATMFLDLTKTIGFLVITGFEFNLTSIAAILTIMGFSISDKVVVYDRVRENLRRNRRVPLRQIIDRSINETLSRTIGTSLALFLAIAPLAVFGGPALREFALTLQFGLVLATSSSIFIAAPILLSLGEKWLSPAGSTRATAAGSIGATVKH